MLKIKDKCDPRRLLLTQAQIAEATGFTQPFIHLILNGDRMPSAEAAVKLEKATGICREGWMWPTRHWNPYVPLCSAPSCPTCINRVNRLRYVMRTAVDYLKTVPDKWKALQTIADCSMMLNGYDDSHTIFFMRKLEDGAVFVTDPTMNRDLPSLKGVTLKASEMPWAWSMVQAKRPIMSSPFPDGLPDAAEGFIDFLRSRRVRSYLLIPGEVVLHGFASNRNLFFWGPDHMMAFVQYVKHLDDVLHEDDIDILSTVP
jgi:hypothetical protein